MPRFVRDLALTGGTQVGQAAAAMLAGVAVSRTIGPRGNGTLSVLMAISAVAVLLGSIGVHYSGVYFLGRFEERWDAVISNNLVFGVVGGVITAGITIAVVLIFRRQLLADIAVGTFLIFVAFIPCNYFNNFARRVELGAGRVAMYNLPDLVGGPGLLAGTLAALAVFGRHIEPLVVVRVAIEVVVAVALLIHILGLVRIRFAPSRRLLREQVNYGVRNYAGSLFWLLLLQSDVVLCNGFLGSGQTGVYSVAVSLGLPVTLIASVTGTLVFQRVSRDQNRVSRVANTNRVLRLLGPLCVVGAIALAIGCHWGIPLVYGHRFAGAADALAILLPGLVLLSLEQVVMSFLAGEGSPPIIYRAPVVGLVLNIGANLVVIPAFGINGASATSSVGYAVVFVLVLGYYMRSTGSGLSEVFLARAADLRAVWPGRSSAPAPPLIYLTAVPTAASRRSNSRSQE